MAVDPLLRQLVEVFAAEAQELCRRATLDLLELERATAGGPALSERYERVARALHTLKGSAATLGLPDVAELAHALEEVLAPLLSNLSPIPKPAMDGLLGGLDLVLSRTRAHQEGTAEELPPVKDLLAGLRRKEDGLPPPPAAPVVDTRDDHESWRVSTPQVVALMREVERLREVRLRFEARVKDLQLGLTELEKLEALPQTAEPRALFAGVRRRLELDIQEVGEVIDSLEEGVQEICTLPVRTILDPLHRTVRDVAQANGKDCRMSVVGGELSLDRRLLEGLKGPLVHLVRNAVDHGIEPCEERERSGKHREGSLVIRIEQEGNTVFLEISDDGAGLDLRRIRQVAQERGVASEAELAAMEIPRLQQLIFRAGFSTRAEVTGTSGRGVGLDVVQAQVSALEGKLEVVSTPGQGTRFLLTLPTDLGSSPVLEVRCEEHRFGVPAHAVERVMWARESELRVEQDQMKYQVGGELLPLSDLGALLCLRLSEAPSGERAILVLRTQGERATVAVDEVLGERDLVIRPLPPELRHVPAYQGASMMARRNLLLVLRPAWLVRPGAAEAVSTPGTRRALVVDDSLSARAMHRAMLEAGGFTVYPVSSARQALEQLRRFSFDVVVSDIDMPEMDGLAFAAALRGQARTSAVPLILVSSHDSTAEMERGLAAGADGFLGKKDCITGKLLQRVGQVIAKRRSSA